MQREKSFKYWMDISTKYKGSLENKAPLQILLKSIFDILPLVTKKKIFEATPEKQFLENLGVERAPDSHRKNEMKNLIVGELLKFFEESSTNKNSLSDFLNNLRRIFSVNLKNHDLNDYILKLVSFLIGFLAENHSNMFPLRVCLKFLVCQDMKFRDDLVENMFQELKKNDFKDLQYFNILIYKLLNSNDHKIVTERFLKTLKFNNLTSIFVPILDEKENKDVIEIAFKRRKLDFTSTPLGKGPSLTSNGECIEQCLEKMCSQSTFIKANLKRPLTSAESNLTKKLIKNLQSIL